jgi:hypothetical protein
MDLRDLEGRIASLPEAAQQEVEALVTRLEHEYTAPSSHSEASPSDIQTHPFLGTWSGRDDMTDSREWVRTVREQQWGPSDE